MVASSAQMAGAKAASWTRPLKRSLWGDSPSPVGLRRAWPPAARVWVLCRVRASPAIAAPLEGPRRAGANTPGRARSLEGLGPRPGSRAGPPTTAHSTEPHPRMTDSNSFSSGDRVP